MSNEAFDRAVKALGDKLGDGRRFSKNETPDTWSRYEELVRVVLQAVREPSTKQLGAARDWSVKKNGIGVGNDQATGCYQAMVDALLK